MGIYHYKMHIPFSKDELITKLKKDPTCPLFIILSQILIDENNLKSAFKICNTGVLSHPESIEGNFLLAKIFFKEKKFYEAEKHLKFVVNHHDLHINAIKLLGEVQRTLNRSPNTLKNTIDKILQINTKDLTALKWLQEINSYQKSEKVHSKPKQNQHEKPIKGITDEWEKVIPISMRMATLTLAEVYKNQGYYLQAKEVLKIVERKGGNAKRIKKMRSLLEKLIHDKKTKKI